MNFIKDKVLGIDIPIQQMQTYLYAALLKKWNLNDGSYDMHGRAYRNQTDDGYSPEVYTGNKGYKEVLFDDRLGALTFFALGEDTKILNRTNVTAPVSIIFMVDLSKISPLSTRADEDIRVDVQKLVLAPMFGFNLTDIVLGIDNVFKDYSGWKIKDGIKFRDMHPKHCFRLDFKVLYSIYAC